jgi:hypothetical protein
LAMAQKWLSNLTNNLPSSNPFFHHFFRPLYLSAHWIYHLHHQYGLSRPGIP